MNDVISNSKAWPHARVGSKPFIRWWWLGGPFRKGDIATQLDWLKAKGFGGVELAWLEPLWQPADGQPRPTWLSPEWTKLVEFTKQYADSIDLGCDFTFGSAWPFGAGCVDDEHATRTFYGLMGDYVWASWEEGPRSGHRVFNHLDERALRLYAEHLLPGFRPALSGTTSALFCDSLELRTEGLWSEQLWDEFHIRFGYDLREFAECLDDFPQVRYDYRKLIAETFTDQFFRAFTAICRENGACSRVQCHGAPVDLIEAYAAVDVPESEAILFEPHFSRIPASAAALAGRPVVSAESFTCVYGFYRTLNDPARKHWKRDQVADLKLLADSLFANGVNQIIWHGMPFNGPGGSNEFYASVHVGPDALIATDLVDFNDYLTRVSKLMSSGQPVCRLAVYLPNEDNWMQNRIPSHERTPAANYRWEMRHVTVPKECAGYSPLWISSAFFAESRWTEGGWRVGNVYFDGLYVDCQWLDHSAVTEIVRLARAGLPVVLKRLPGQPGHLPKPNFGEQLEELSAMPNVVGSLDQLHLTSVIQGNDLPPYWARQEDGELHIFFAHPLTASVSYPMSYGQSRCDHTVTREVRVHWAGHVHRIELAFEPYQSLAYRIGSQSDATYEAIDVHYLPPLPLRD